MWEKKVPTPGSLMDQHNEKCPTNMKSDCEFEVKKVRYSDFLTTMKYIYRNEGIWSFTKGVFPRMCINVPSTALSWGTYEETQITSVWLIKIFILIIFII